MKLDSTKNNAIVNYLKLYKEYSKSIENNEISQALELKLDEAWYSLSIDEKEKIMKDFKLVFG